MASKRGESNDVRRNQIQHKRDPVPGGYSTNPTGKPTFNPLHRKAEAVLDRVRVHV